MVELSLDSFSEGSQPPAASTFISSILLDPRLVLLGSKPIVRNRAPCGCAKPTKRSERLGTDRVVAITQLSTALQLFARSVTLGDGRPPAVRGFDDNGAVPTQSLSQ